MKIEVIISANGNVDVQTKGYTGSSCQEASKFIEQALGKRVDEKLTAEFHQAESTRQTSQQQA